MLPLLVLLDVLESRGSGCEVPQNFRSGAIVPFWIGVRSLHRVLICTLHAIPLLFRCFALHARQ
jgi:hypothetical protein